jgi:hypothetical protein
MTVVVATEDAVYEGPAIDLREAAVTPETLVDAIQTDTGSDVVTLPSSEHVSVTSPPSTTPHELLGHVGDGGASLRARLAAAARSRGHTAPRRPQYDTVVERLQELDAPAVDVEPARRRVADAGAEEDRLREQMATLRGRLQARRETAADTDGVASELAETAARLSEVETERIAAEQALNRQERRAAEARETRERRFELEDRAANLERRMRASLAERVYPAFVDALDALAELGSHGTLPSRGLGEPEQVGEEPSDFVGHDLTAHLGAVRIADLDAPVVLSVPAFDTATTAARYLDASVILL